MQIIHEYQAYERELRGLQAIADEFSSRGRRAFAVNLEGLIHYVQGQVELLFGLHGAAVWKPRPQVLPNSPKIDLLSGPESLRNHTCISCKLWLDELYFVANVCPGCGRYPRPT